MINQKQIKEYCKEQGWNCSTSYGKIMDNAFETITAEVIKEA